jgi:hypothetical protein
LAAGRARAAAGDAGDRVSQRSVGAHVEAKAPRKSQGPITYDDGISLRFPWFASWHQHPSYGRVSRQMEATVGMRGKGMAAASLPLVAGLLALAGGVPLIPASAQQFSAAQIAGMKAGLPRPTLGRWMPTGVSSNGN